MIENKTFHNPEFIKRKRHITIRRAVIIFSVIFLVIAGCAGITHWNKVQIQYVRVYGAELLSVDDILHTTQRQLFGNYLYIFAKNNPLLYSRKEITQALLAEYPRIKTLDVNLSDLHTISITLSERQPFALWCDSVPQTPSTDTSLVPNCYFLDQNGFVFSHAPNFSGDAYFKYYGLLPYQSPIGSTYVSSSNTFSQLSDFVASIKKLNITPLYMVAQNQDEFELYIYGGGKIIFDDHASFPKTVERLTKLLQTANLIPQTNGKLLVDYIDLRFGNKLYYKVRSE